jgi:SOS-response transcriptional repressor LexA|tara:strand:- start:429 stop:1076 length:648 start_codon:yes stop_codon:yes gene_type:complete
MNQSERIAAAMRNKGLTKSALARKCGVSAAAVGQWISQDTKAPKAENMLKIAEATGCRFEWLTTGKGQMLKPETNVDTAPNLTGYCPEISWVQAGHWAEVCDINTDPETTNWYPRPPGASEQTFVLRVVGESMVPDYPPGRLIFVDPEQVPLPNDDVVAVMTESNEATFKRLIEEPGSPRMLKALNPAWNNPYLEINGNCQIIGVVIADMRMRQR